MNFEKQSRIRILTVIIIFVLNCLVAYLSLDAFYTVYPGFGSAQVTLFLGLIYGGFILLFLLGLIPSMQTRKALREKGNISNLAKLMANSSILGAIIISIGYMVGGYLVIYQHLWEQHIVTAVDYAMQIFNYTAEIIVLLIVLLQLKIITNQNKLLKGVISEKPMKAPVLPPSPVQPTPITRERDILREETMEKIKQMMRVSTKINLDRMQNALKMKKEIFDEKVFEWAENFGFTIDGDYLIVNKETVSDFIDTLDKQFESWQKVENEKEGKI